MGRQTEFNFKTWGGRRKGAGRKPKAKRAGVPHRMRPRFDKRMPVHVTLKMASHVWNLRSRRSLEVVQEAVAKGAETMAKRGARVVQMSIQGNHIHLLVEADRTLALVRSMKGLTVRIALGVNRLMERSGRVFSDRYHTHLLRTPTEVRRAVHYIRNNHRHHHEDRAQFSPGYVDRYCSDSPKFGMRLPEARTHLVRQTS